MIVEPDARLVVHRRKTGRRSFPADREVWEDAGRFLVVGAGGPVLLRHEEHDALVVPKGVYEVRRQREYAPARPVWVRD